MKHRALCVLLFPVGSFVDKTEVIFVLRFTFQVLLKYLLCFGDIYFHLSKTANGS